MTAGFGPCGHPAEHRCRIPSPPGAVHRRPTLWTSHGPQCDKSAWLLDSRSPCRAWPWRR